MIDRVRKVQDQSSEDATQNSNKHSWIWDCLCLQLWKHLYSREKHPQKIYIPSKNRKDLTLKQMFAIFAKLITEQSDVFMEWFQQIGNTLHVGIYLWWVSHAKVYEFSWSVLCLERWGRIHNQILFGGKVDVVQKFITIQGFGHSWWWANGIQVQHFPRIHHSAALLQSPRVLAKIGWDTRYLFTGRIIMSMMNDISWRSEDIQQDTKWYFTHGSRPRGKWDRVAELMMVNFAESGHPVFRVSSPLSRGTLKRKGRGKLSEQTSSALKKERLKLFRTTISVYELSIYGAVSDLCDEYSACQGRTVKTCFGGTICTHLFVPTCVMKTLTHLIDDLAQKDLLQKYNERVERLSQQNRVIKNCTDAGCLTTVGWCRTVLHDKRHWSNSHEFTDSVACREYTFDKTRKIIWPERLDSREHQNWARVRSHNQLICKENMKWKIEMNLCKDNAHSWVQKELSQVLSERGDPLILVFRRNFSKMAFMKWFFTDGLFTADGGLL